MLFELSIRNFAIIEKETVQFCPGLNIISGETGSGKSLISDAILAVMGGKLTKEDIRSGAEKLLVEAQFTDIKKELLLYASENGIEPEEDGSLILSREYNENGKSVCRANGRIITLTVLKEMASMLVDLIGQHDHQKLMSSEKHLELLDSVGGKEILSLKEEVETIFKEIMGLESKANDFLASPEERARAIDLLSFQLSEISEAKLYETEEAELKERKLRMMNAEKIANGIGSAFEAVFQGNDSSSARDSLAVAIRSLDQISAFDGEIGRFTEPLNGVLATLDDLKYDLRNHMESIRFDMNELNEVEQRLDLWTGMKRKYGKTFAEIMAFKDSAEKKKAELCEAEELLEQLNREKSMKVHAYMDKAGLLSEKRTRIGKKLKEKIEKELHQLNMKGAEFSILVEKNADRIAPEGMDQVAFLLSANPGEPLKPLDKVASGGEISRVMLALKTSTQKGMETSTMLFDEIDSGIGGKTALLVGDKIGEVSKETQVICITHLAQIASLKGDHIRVEKETLDGRTVARIRKIDGLERVKELARMLNGDDQREESLQAAKALIDSRN